MLPAIGLNDYTRSKVHEINHIRANRLLTPELLSVQSMCPQVSTQLVFAIRHLAPQVPGEFPLLHHFSPLPQGERGFDSSTNTLLHVRPGRYSRLRGGRLVESRAFPSQ